MRTRLSRAVVATMLILGFAATAGASDAGADTSQTIAAGSSAKNLPTESVWAGSQSPPYVCCWGSQGQFVTFSFSVGGGSTNLGLRYSSGNGVARRKIELDGVVWVANQAFAATASWSSWSTVTLNQPALAAGTHTLKVWFDSAAGSSQFINLDNLTVTQLSVPPPVPVNTALPVISGVAQQGQSLSVSTGTWTNSPTSFAYTWNRCSQSCVPIGGALTSTYLLAPGDVGATITATVVASNAGGNSLPATSTPTAIVTVPPPPPVPVNTALPTISGTALQGQSLSVSTGTWTNSPTSFAYTWNRCSQSCVPIGGALTSTYLLAPGDVGATITATVVASNAGGDGVAATSAPTATVVAFSGGGSQTIAAGTSAKNLPTETVWAGSQSPPYVCCWGSQGQFVTFSFSVGGGSTNLALRYSAGNGLAHRKIELDGSVLLANQAFAATATWNTWSTVTVNQPALAAGPHTLKVWFDSAAGSNQFINLDNLTVTEVTVAPPPEGLVVSLGYAHSTTGLTPWSGSPDTIFIGEGPQCCLTWGPGNGSPGYDAGVIQVTNTSESSVVVNSVTVDFGGGSLQPHFDLWSGSTSPHLPQTLAPGAHLVLTMTSGFNFDTSDQFGEACYDNSGVTGVVHVTMNGLLTDYVDSHQILNSDGTDVEFCPSAPSEQAPFTVVVPGTQPAAAPVNAWLPTVTVAGAASSTSTPVVGRVLSGINGAWNASPPPTLSSRWTQCDVSGNTCSAIAGATDATYIPTAADVGSTLRLSVTASNASGSVAASSVSTAVVESGPAVAQLGHTLTGSSAKLISNTTELSWISTATVSGTTNDFAFFARGSSLDQTFTPKIYSVVNGTKGTLLATGVPITVRRAVPGQWYVTSLSGLHLSAGTQYLLALGPSGGLNATYVGAEEDDGELCFFVDFTPA